jgi:hypothetical protein
MTTHLWIYSIAGLVVGMITLAFFRRPYFMNYLEKADARFIAQARDDSRRRAAIEHLSEVRRSHYGMAVMCTTVLCLLFVSGFVYHALVVPEGAIIAAGFGTLVAWLRAIKSESDLRLLKVVDGLKQ